MGLPPGRGVVLMLQGVSPDRRRPVGRPRARRAFHKWGTALAEASAKVGVAQDRLVYLVGSDEGTRRTLASGPRARKSTRRSRVREAAAPEDVVYIVLFGHGSFDGQAARFNLPGPDITAADFNTMIRRVPARNVVFVNTSSSSGPFVEALSAQGRTIITATRSGAEQFTTLFGGYFVEAFSRDMADADKNKRISMLEAFQYAKAEVARAYEREGLLATEHAMLDDNGDKNGSQDTGGDRRRRQARCRAVARVGGATPRRCPKTRSCARCIWSAAISSAASSRCGLLKDSMPPAKYTSELERLVTDLALKTREIRRTRGETRNHD